MAWNNLIPTQTISFNNLQDAVTDGLFTTKTAIPPSDEQITKADANTYVNIDTNYASYAAKLSNQLVVKQDLQSTSSNISVTIVGPSCKINNYQFYFTMSYNNIPSGYTVSFDIINNGSNIDAGFCSDGRFGMFWPNGQTTGTLQGTFVVKDLSNNTVYTSPQLNQSYQGFWVNLSACTTCTSSFDPDYVPN